MTITISHTPAEGTLVHGTSRGDGTNTILKTHGFRWFRTLGLWGIPGSRDRQPQMHKINAAASALRDAGHTVTTDLDTSYRAAAEVEADRAERSEARAEALAAKAARKTAAADTAWAAERRVAALMPPFGQPILIGHHSEARHRRLADRLHAAGRRAVDATNEANRAQQRARSAAVHNDFRHSPVTVKNRIDRLSAEQRKDQRELDGHSRVIARTATHTYRDEFPPATGAYREKLLARIAARADEIDYWTTIYTQLQESGKASTHSRDTIARGDLIRHRNTWYPVVRVNPKTVSIRPFAHASFTQTVGYHEITGHRRPTTDTPDAEAAS